MSRLQVFHHIRHVKEDGTAIGDEAAILASDEPKLLIGRK